MSVNRKFDPANKVEDETKLVRRNSKARSGAGSVTGSTARRSESGLDRFSAKDESMKTPFDNFDKNGVGFFNEMGYTYNEREKYYMQKNDLFKFSTIDGGRDTPVIDAREFNSGYVIQKSSEMNASFRTVERKSVKINVGDLHNGPKQKYLDTYY